MEGLVSQKRREIENEREREREGGEGRVWDHNGGCCGRGRSRKVRPSRSSFTVAVHRHVPLSQPRATTRLPPRLPIPPSSPQRRENSYTGHLPVLCRNVSAVRNGGPALTWNQQRTSLRFNLSLSFRLL